MIWDRRFRAAMPSALAVLIVSGAWPCLFPTALLASNPRRSAVVEVVERVRPAVVNIHSERNVRGGSASDVFNQTPSSNRVNGMGTGVIVDPRGYIVTNNHVVDDVALLRVRLNDASSYPATVVARDNETDLAMLKIDAGRPLPTVPLGTAHDLMVGETVIAIGNAYGYEHSVTMGVVSAIKRDVTLNKEVSYKSLIQTDASINPGNSGGPLLNINGEMVGINVAIRAGAQGISFAIPVDTMIRVASDLLVARKNQGLWHGLVCQDRVSIGGTEFKLQSANPRSDAEAKTDTSEWKRELVVDRVEPGSPAEKCGAKPGDVFVRLADQEVRNSLDLSRVLLDRGAGDQLPLIVRRKGEPQNLDLVLQASQRSAPSNADVIWRKVGLRLQTVSPEQVGRTSPQLRGGLTVTDVFQNGVADKAGIQRGDILVGMHIWETLAPENVAFVLSQSDLASFNPVTFYVIRGGQVRRGSMQITD